MSYWRILLFSIVVILFFHSCNELPFKVKDESKYVKDNYVSYSKIRNSLIDTLDKWKRDSLSISTGFFYDNDWQVDSMLIFNQDSSRFFTTMNRKQRYVVGSSDIIKEIIGLKVSDKWFFSLGSVRIIGRNGKIQDVTKPMTFEQLSYVARTNIMAPFINYYPNGTYKLNYDYMESFFYKGYRSSYPDKKEIDSIVLSRIAKYQEKKISNEDIQYVLSLRKDSNLKSTEEKPWWKNVFSWKPTPLFETEEWKCSLMKK